MTYEATSSDALPAIEALHRAGYEVNHIVWIVPDHGTRGRDQGQNGTG